MVLRRLAFFIAVVVGLVATQIPAYVVQYKQALGGAIGELAAIVSNFDSRSSQVGLTQTAAIDRLRANPDPIVSGEGEQMQVNVKRLAMLREAQTAFKNAGPIARLGTFVTHYDQRIARSAWSEFEPAVPTSAEALVLGILGFVVSRAALHVAGRLFRRRRDRTVHRVEPAT